jgi:putative DNA primase/helicase
LLEELASPVAAFVEECCELDPCGQTVTTDLFVAWCLWCQKHGREPGNDASFGADLNALYQGRITKVQHKSPSFYRTYDGIRLTEPPM